jgi:hypothetical protein
MTCQNGPLVKIGDFSTILCLDTSRTGKGSRQQLALPSYLRVSPKYGDFTNTKEILVLRLKVAPYHYDKF